jgi:hypothetical protein
MVVQPPSESGGAAVVSGDEVEVAEVVVDGACVAVVSVAAGATVVFVVSPAESPQPAIASTALTATTSRLVFTFRM